MLRENLDALRARYGDRDLAVVSALESLALRENEAGAPQAALALLLEARGIAASILEGPHVIAGYVENSLGFVALHAADPAQASQAFERALVIFTALLYPPHRLLEATHANRGEAVFERGDFAAVAAFEAAQAQREALDPQSQRGAVRRRRVWPARRTRVGAMRRAHWRCSNLVSVRCSVVPAPRRRSWPRHSRCAPRSSGARVAATPRRRARCRRSPPGRRIPRTAALVPLRVLAEIGLARRATASVREWLDAALGDRTHALPRPRPWRQRLATVAPGGNCRTEIGDAARATVLRSRRRVVQPGRRRCPQPPQ